MSNKKSKKDKTDIESDVEIIYESDIESNSDIESKDIKDSLFDDDNTSDISSCSLLKFTIDNDFYSKEKTTKLNDSDSSGSLSELSNDSSSELSNDSSSEISNDSSSELSDSSSGFDDSDYSSNDDSSENESLIDSVDSIDPSLQDFITDKKKGGDNNIFDNSTLDLLKVVK
jgi:hypothetical protein